MQNHEPIYDVKTLGVGKTLVLGLQHTFAMFGATVLVPALTGLSVSATLLFAGLGTLLFHLLTKGLPARPAPVSHGVQPQHGLSKLHIAHPFPALLPSDDTPHR